jgi:cytochrome b561
MNSASPTSIRYDRRTIALHWLTALLVIALWALGQTIDLFPKGVARVAARSLHISLGVALALVLAYRLWWRAGAGTKVAPVGAGWLDVVATLVHKALYLLMICTVLLGLANVWVRGDTLFNLFTVPAFDAGNKALRETVEGLHGWSANTLLILALLHACAALLHHVVLKDEVLRRMLPLR